MATYEAARARRCPIRRTCALPRWNALRRSRHPVEEIIRPAKVVNNRRLLRPRMLDRCVPPIFCSTFKLHLRPLFKAKKLAQAM